MLRRFDKNGDGKLDEEERATMRETLKKEKAPGPSGSGDIGSLSYASGPGAPGGGMDNFRQELLKRFDKDGDGKLDATELTEMVKARQQMQPNGGPGVADATRLGAELLKRFDKNGVGKLDAEELAELAKARQQMQQNGGVDRFRAIMLKMFDKNGDGVLDESERAEADKFRAEQIKRFDKDGDGKLNDEERAEALRAFMAEHPDMAPPGR
jgi:Ca2+-binding EF-hand superfamily protein